MTTPAAARLRNPFPGLRPSAPTMPASSSAGTATSKTCWRVFGRAAFLAWSELRARVRVLS